MGKDEFPCATIEARAHEGLHEGGGRPAKNELAERLVSRGGAQGVHCGTGTHRKRSTKKGEGEKMRMTNLARQGDIKLIDG